VARLMLRLIPKNHILVHLDSDFEAVKERRQDLTDPEDFYQFQRRTYNRLSSRLKAVKINTVKWNVNETAMKVRTLVLPELNH
jgi:hypothetical protein